ncbi:DNA polymerase II [Vibrio stylophorae]|nr:DNA polymerase II [Vibrio stylophorae]
MPPTQGFLLTAQSRDFGQQTQIECWLATEQGPVQLLIDSEPVVIFTLSAQREKIRQLLATRELQSVQMKPLALKDFQHQAIDGCYCQTQAQAKNLAQALKQSQLTCYEDDIRLHERYLMERFILGGLAFQGQAQWHASTRHAQQGHWQITQAKVKSSEVSPKLSWVSLDLECSGKGVLYSIGLYGQIGAQTIGDVLMVGQAPEPESKPEPMTDSVDASQSSAQDYQIHWVSDEKTLLLALCDWFDRHDPDLILGWNVLDFDMRLLIQRAQYQHLSLRLGRGGQAAHWRDSTQGGRGFLTLPGRVVLDGISALKNATYGFSSWSLESVSQQLLGEGKAIESPHDRLAEIERLFREDKLALAHYNFQDCVLVAKIFAHTHLLDYLIERSGLTGLLLDRAGGSVAAFTNLYLPRLHRGGYVAPNLASESWIASPGGFVMDSNPGLYDSVLVLDFKSLYPSIIRSFYIDPMGLIEGLAHSQGELAIEGESCEATDDIVPGFRGGVFHRQQHFLPEMIAKLWHARDEAKAKGEKAFSQAIKIIMNSFYGVLGSSGCRFFDHRLASSITMRGHAVMKETRLMIESQGYQVIYGDTDSVFVSLGQSHSQKQADEIGQHLVDFINQNWQQILEQRYQLACHLELEYETHYRRFLMPRIRGAEMGSKKRYAGLMGEGEDAKMVFKGLETVRSDWTPLAQQFQQTLYRMIFDGESPDSYVRDYVERTKSGDYDDLLVYRKRLRRHLSEYQKNIPPQVKAARMADEINIKLGRDPQYQHKGTIAYVITVHGPEPHEFQQSAVDYDHYIEKQLKPVADAILPFIGKDFDALIAPQMGLF